jgi:hypothetical protein
LPPKVGAHCWLGHAALQAHIAPGATRLLPPLIVCAGDDPNYWMWVTREADAEYVAKKVRKMLAEINEPGSHQVSTTYLQ